MISPNLVLTAAHNLFDIKTEELFQRIKFYPGHFGIFEK